MSLYKNSFELHNKVKNIHEVLINACLVGDQKAQYKIYKLYYKAMYNTSYRILKNEMDAEDVMQEAFLDAFQKIHQYDKSAAFGAWLKRIVINKSLDKYRKQENYIPFDEVHEDVTDSVEEDYFEVLSMKIDDIRRSIERLTDSYRIILSLYLLEGYDHKEIAQILGISYNASRTKYSRAKQQLLVKIKQFQLSKSVNLN
ncbi:MAG: sigma-70 family RNA polymerase sigma factor [Bacteroidetes bacterium]|nr:sigma-70 family RNA polymerase sigma factor [Bacteroidota bacterium]